MKTYSTNYATAVNWCNNDYVLCNNIPQIDLSIYDDIRCSDDVDFYKNESLEIFQYFISSCSDDDVNWLTEHFSGLAFAYSSLLDCWVLLVTHYGTSWDYVGCSCDFENAARELGQRK